MLIEKKIVKKVLKVSSPVLTQRAWQIESFLLKIFEYGDYNFRLALSGKLNRHLQCTFFIAENKGNILAAAGSLYSLNNPAVAILGPVGVEPKYRRKGLARELCELLLEYLKAQGVQVIYLGVKDNNVAVNLYKKLGFEKFSGIVMRKLFVSKDEFNKRYFSAQKTIVRKMNWQDFSEVSALLCEPADMYTFDFDRRIFSAKYVESSAFLPVFPRMMKALEEGSSIANVLQVKENSSIVGVANINIQASKVQSHIAVLDFFTLDDFTNKAAELVDETIKQAAQSSDGMIISYCLDCDTAKKQILKSFGAKLYSTLPAYFKINYKLKDVIIYKL